jgi:hypothetical protein
MNKFDLSQYANTSANEVALFKNIPIDLIEVARSAVREFQAKNPTLGKYRFRFRGSNRPQSHCPRWKAERISVYFYQSHHNVSY